MDLQTVSDISRAYGVSTRMLRYYEQIGLISSRRKEGYAYRVYDEHAILRLQQVIILRKLQIPVKQIFTILSNPDAATAVDIFRRNMQDLDSEITALSTIRKILGSFISELEKVASVRLNMNFMSDDSVSGMLASLSLVQKNTKEKIMMKELTQADEVLSGMHRVKVRVYLYYNGNCAEAIALYEKAFDIKAEYVLRYKDAPPEDRSHYPSGTEDFVMNSWLMLGADEIGTIGMCDRKPGDTCRYGDGVAVHVSLGSADAVRRAFDVLREGGKVIMPPGTIFFSECYCEVSDKFGIVWILMYN